LATAWPIPLSVMPALVSTASRATGSKVRGGSVWVLALTWSRL
jgi:hypothetical protein